MSEVTKGEKTELLRGIFPRALYPLRELAEVFCCHKDTVTNWLRAYEVPTFKVNGSPFILQANLINFLLRADERSLNEENDVGLEFCVLDIKKNSEIGRNRPKTEVVNER